MPLLLLLVRYVFGISAVAVVPNITNTLPVACAPTAVRGDPVISSVDDVASAAITPASNSGNNKNKSDVNGSTDAINSKQTRTNSITEC